MTIEVESAHLVVHLSQRSTLYGVNLRKKLWKCSQRSLKEENPLGGVLFLQIQNLDILYLNVPWSCRLYRYSNVITCTDSTVEHTEDEGLGADILVLRCVRWQKLELSCRISIREKFSQVNCSASNCLTSRSSRKKRKKKTDEEENEILEYDSLPVMKNRMSHFWTTRPHALIITLSLERETRYLRGRFFPLWRKYSFQQQIVFSWLFVISLVLEAKGFPSPFFLFYALVDIVIRFLDTDLSLIICLSVIEVKTEGNRHRN